MRRSPSVEISSNDYADFPAVIFLEVFENATRVNSHACERKGPASTEDLCAYSVIGSESTAIHESAEALEDVASKSSEKSSNLSSPASNELLRGNSAPVVIPVYGAVGRRIPYVVSALSSEWRQATDASDEQPMGCEHPPRVQVFLPADCPVTTLRTLLGRLAADAENVAIDHGLHTSWQPVDINTALRLVQVASMLQIEELLSELTALVQRSVQSSEDLELLNTACQQLELPAVLREVEAHSCGSLAPAALPDENQLRGMIASALLTADGKVWRVVQKVIDKREAWPHLAKQNSAILLEFATGVHGSIRATPHTGFFWGSRDFLYLVCRNIRRRPERFDAMVSAVFDSVYSMEEELPAEVIDAVFKELLAHEGLSFAQCDHIITKMMQREDQLEHLFHEWSGVFPQLPATARQALSKGLLPAVGKCPHLALDFVLKELDAIPSPPGRPHRLAGVLGSNFVNRILFLFGFLKGGPSMYRKSLLSWFSLNSFGQ